MIAEKKIETAEGEKKRRTFVRSGPSHYGFDSNTDISSAFSHLELSKVSVAKSVNFFFV